MGTAQLSWDTPINSIKGVGEATQKQLNQIGIFSVADAMLKLPIHYLDRSERCTIAQLEPGVSATVVVEIMRANQVFIRGKTITTATIKDETGTLKCIWFNLRHLITQLNSAMAGHQKLFVAGEVSAKGELVQPTIELFSESPLHTGRVVPVYSASLGIPQGKWRRILYTLTNQFRPEAELADELTELSLSQALKQIHFPDSPDSVAAGRERLAFEELLTLIQLSDKTKAQWNSLPPAQALPGLKKLPPLPFTLTNSQALTWQEISADISHSIAMNRILVGDVGSGKTVIAGLAVTQALAAGQHAALVAPTKILAEQHAKTLAQLFPQLALQIVTSQTKITTATSPTLWVGTHSILNQLATCKPAVIIFDEQHKFGVTHRSLISQLQPTPHTLTMTATPIPRSLMLTLFSHLQASYITELPPGRIPTKTWVVPQGKEVSGLDWIGNQLAAQPQRLCLVVCPFIDTSQTEGLAHVPAVKPVAKKLAAWATKHDVKLGILHGQQSPAEQANTIKRLINKDISLLIATPMVEVGLDLPQADYMVVYGAERFGLASLHQLRGRVGRSGQPGYCLLFTSLEKTNSQILSRLSKFAQEPNGLKIAELDLDRRGAGDLFGTAQHGFSDLQFAAWTNRQQLLQAQQAYAQFSPLHPDWISWFNKYVKPNKNSSFYAPS